MTRNDYLRAVGLALRDLPRRQRRRLLADLRGHLAELPPETDIATLGTPERYAAELRAAAGLHHRRGVAAFIRTRRPRNVLLTVLTLTAIGLTIGAVVWVDSYQPLSNPGHWLFPPGKSLLGLDGVQAEFHAGRPFEFGISIENGGPFTVRILGVPWEEPNPPWKARLMMSQPHVSTGGTYGPNVPFHPVDLAPGHDFFLFLKGVYACREHYDAGAFTYTDFPVRYSFLWRTATTRIPLPEPFAIHFAKDCRP